ncbi:hypothetical protein SK128_001385 [Halocaridina rubra]|uniref:Uncharacterized protein n=1 Tax=Halocaridina rubra TaxID=373956 RepID=A0AAN8X5K9_HALRR
MKTATTTSTSNPKMASVGLRVVLLMGEGAIVAAGQYSYTAPDGTEVLVTYVADENGFQPQSDLLPVAPLFPHPIPEFVLEQIAFAAEQDRLRALEESHERPSVRNPSGTYRAPQ